VESPDSAGNLNATYNNGSSGVGATLTNAGTQAALVIDGVTLSVNDRVLIYNQTNAYENGIYTVTNTGSASTNWVMTRATDADSYGASDPNALGQGDAFFVKEGDTGAGELYVMNTEGTITFGTTAITFTVVAETAVYQAGTGLTLTGTTFSTNQDISTTASPTFVDVTATNDITVGGTVDGRDVAADGTKLDGIEAGADVTDATNVAAAGAAMTSGATMTGALNFGDNVSATFGAGPDLQIYHTGSHSYVDETGTGNLYINSNGAGTIITGAGGTQAQFFTAGAVNLFHNNSQKLATTSTGVDVTGNITVSGTVDGRDVAADGTKLDGIATSADNYSSWSARDADGTTYTVTSGDVLQFAEGTGIDVNFTADDVLTITNTAPDQTVSIAGGGATTVSGTYPNFTVSSTDTNTTYTAGSGLGLAGTVFSHADTSSQASVNNSNGVVIQDVTVDTYGHVTALGSVDLDGRYYLATNPSGYISGNQTITLSGDVSGSGTTSIAVTVADDSHNHSINTITDEHRLFNNMGDNHSTQTDFNSISNFGTRFVQGSTNGPGTGSSQFYGFTLGLGNEYALSQYGLQFAIPRYTATDNYLSFRAKEGGTWGSWVKAAAGNADKLTTARNIALTGAVTGNANFDGSGNISIATTATSDPTLTLAGDASGSATFTNLGNATLTVTVVDDSHNHTYLNERTNITFGASYLQWTDLSGTAGTGGNGSTPYNPTNDWYHHIISNHANSNGYYIDQAFCFHTNDHYINRMVNGTLTTVKLWNDGNDGSGSGLDADLLDGVHGSSFLRSDTADTASGALTFTGAVTLGNGANYFNGHHYFTAYDTNGNHYPHYLSGGSNNGAQVNIRVQQPSSSGYDVFYIPGGSNDITWRGNKVWNAGNDGSGSGLDADLLDGYHLSTTRNAANTVPVRDANGYLQLGWINTTSGATTSTINKIYASYDDYVRYVTPATLVSQLGLWTSGNDGSGSGLDADLLDGVHGSSFVRNNNGSQSVSGGFFTNSGLGSSGANTMAANLGTAATTWNNAQLELRNTDAGRVGMTFHRSGYTEISLSHYTSGVLELSGSFTASGNVTAYSDERLKSNIQTIPDALDKVSALRGVTFEKDGVAGLGVIAQEVQKVLPEVVQNGEEYLSVAYGNIVGVLIEAIKELRNEVDDLKRKLDGSL